MRKLHIMSIVIFLITAQMITPAFAFISPNTVLEETNYDKVEEKDNFNEVEQTSNIEVIEDVSAQPDAIKIITDLIEAENQQNWEKYITYWCNDRKGEFQELFQDPWFIENNIGISTVESSSLKGIKKIEESTYDSSAFNKKYDNIETYIIGVDYSVKEVSKYYYNGVNFFLVVTGVEDGIRKILLEPQPSFEFIEKMSKEDFIYLNEAGFAKKDFDTALEIRTAGTYGLIKDSTGEIIG